MANSKVKIVARLRPRLAGELDDESVRVHESGSFVTVANPRDITQVFKFPFTSCYDQHSTQEEIFRNEVQPLVDVVYSGVTVTIFAYGVTSSGKTYTMQGTKSDPGVIPRTVKAMFDQLPRFENHYSVSLAMSYMEIYKDDVYDLLVTRENAPKLPVRENDAGQVFVANLSSEPISCMQEFETIYSRATKHRSTGATNLNHASSRSHAVLTIQATMIDTLHQRILTGKINLVDLAGSENNKLTGNDPSRMAESAAINKSLSVLGQVVHALNQSASRIPYRNSKLTRILQDALGGASVGVLVCNLAPGVKFRQDTLNTLNFAVRTKNIENKPVVNERDTQVVASKPHFAAIRPPAVKLAPAVLQQQAVTAGSGSGSGIPSSRPSLIPNPRSSLLPNARGLLPVRVGRVSAFSGACISFGSSLVGGGRHSIVGGRPMTEKDINERISKAVELEVTRRLEEQKKREEEEQERGGDDHINAEESPEALPSGVLTPLLKRHQDLDEELKARLRELEVKVERDVREVQLADVLSPVSKKRTGRAYVALARAHCQKGHLQVALDLYRKAETYVPDNTKLKERIIEIEWAVKNDREYVPSPKREKMRTGKRRKRAGKVSKGLRESSEVVVRNGGGDGDGGDVDVDEWQDVEEKENCWEVTVSPGKRTAAERDEEGEEVEGETPIKKARRGSAEMEGAPVKRGKRKVGYRK